MTIKERTPMTMKCGIGACPAIFETSNGTYLIVGRRVSTEVAEQFKSRVSPDEEIIEIPKGLLDELGD